MKIVRTIINSKGDKNVAVLNAYAEMKDFYLLRSRAVNKNHIGVLEFSEQGGNKFTLNKLGTKEKAIFTIES